MKYLLALLAVAALLSNAGAGVFDVRDFGAAGDGRTPDTAPIQRALDACADAGGGTVKFPPGTYLSRPLILQGSKMTVEIEAGATLLATTNYADFIKAPGNWYEGKSNTDFAPFVSGTNLADIEFRGGGTIDGSGWVWWGEAEKARERVPGYPLPRPGLLTLDGCRNVRIENIRLQNSPSHNLELVKCEDVVCSHVTIVNPAHSANTDGINPVDSADVLISKCTIDTGDDNIAIKAHAGVEGRKFGCVNIVVRDCTFLHGHGMSVGSETVSGVRNVVVKNCTFENTENGIRLKSARGKGGLVENIVFDDIAMTNVDPAITFSDYYTLNSAQDPVQKAIPVDDAAQAVTERTPVFRDIVVRNLTATCQRGAGMIIGLPESEFSDVVFDNVKISAATGMTIRNARDIRFKKVRVTAADGRPFSVENAEVKGLN